MRETSSSGRWNSSWARNVPTNFGLESDFHVILGIFYMLQICDMGQTALLPLWRKAWWGFFSPLKIWRLWPGLNPQTWVPKASTLTPRPPKLNRLYHLAIMLDSLIIAYIQLLIMLIELQKQLNQEIKCLCSKTTTVLLEGTIPKTIDVSLLHFYCIRNK